MHWYLTSIYLSIPLHGSPWPLPAERAHLECPSHLKKSKTDLGNSGILSARVVKTKGRRDY